MQLAVNASAPRCRYDPSDPFAEGVSLNAVDTSVSRTLALVVAAAAGDKKATDIRILDLGELLGITDFFVLASASNDRQLGTVVDEIERRLKQDLGRAPLRREGTKDTGWIVLDYGEIVVHAFTEEQRAFYDLERLWSDAPTLPLTDPATTS
jgi:ribosome-associated protein